MMMDEQKKADVVDVSHMYVGPNQRQTLVDQAFDRFRKKGFSHNQAKALAVQAVDGFLEEQRRKRCENMIAAVRQAERDGDHASADQMAQDFIDQELPK